MRLWRCILPNDNLQKDKHEEALKEIGTGRSWEKGGVLSEVVDRQIPAMMQDFVS